MEDLRPLVESQLRNNPTWSYDTMAALLDAGTFAAVCNALAAPLTVESEPEE